MLSASRLVAKEVCASQKAASVVGQEVARVSASCVRGSKRYVRHAMRKTVRNLGRTYSTQKKVLTDDERLIAYQNRNPAQPAVVSMETVNNLQPEIDHLRQFLPAVVVAEELAAVDGRVRRAKAAGRKPNVPDCMWLILANLKMNQLEAAVVSWNDLTAQRTPDVLHWNLILVHAAKLGNQTTLSELYENFKLAVMKRKLPGPVPITYNVLLKAFSELGDLERALEIYEDMFNNRWIPELYHLYSVTKAAALAGDPKTFHRFLSRLKHKGVVVDRNLLKGLIDSWGRNSLGTDSLKRSHPTTGDYSFMLGYVLRVHNYRQAHQLIVECRDGLGIQPDARMYETVLMHMIADNFCREEARSLKKRFHKYPKGIEVREEHFEFMALFDKVLALLGDTSNDAKPAATGERIKFARTTRKASGRLFSARLPERYDSGWVHDELEWVPEYAERKKELKLAQEQASKAEELQNIIKKAKTQAASL